MNILTKICIVLLVPLTIVAAVVFTHVAVTVPNYRQKWEQVKGTNAALEARNRRLAAELDSVRDQVTDAVEEGARLQAALASARAEKQDVLDGMASEIATLQRQYSEHVTRLRQTVGASREFYASRTERLLDDAGQARAELKDVQDARTKLADQLRETKAELARMTNRHQLAVSNVQQREETIDELKRRIDSLQTQLLEGGTAGGEAGVTPVDELRPPIVSPTGGPERMAEMVPELAGREVNGTVTGVRDDMISVDVGRTHGVKPGMRMVVMRGSQLVGFLSVEYVETTESAGVVTRMQREPQRGDAVRYPVPATID
ncbi:MAG: hypothetical protein ACOC8F_07865 [Planctomycetota bacterium]